jgi:hypothetical protein
MYQIPKGFTLLEILLAFSLASLVYIPIVGVFNLILQKDNPLVYSQFENYVTKGVKGVNSRFVTDTVLCPHMDTDVTMNIYSSQDLGLGTSTKIERIKAVLGQLVLGLDSSEVKDPDVAVLSSDLKIASKIDMSPGTLDMTLNGSRLYTAQSGVSSDLSMIDLYPNLTLQKSCSLKLDRRDGKTAQSIQSVGEFIVVGFEKNNGPELFLTDSNCFVLDSKELGYGIHDIYVVDSFVYVLGPSNPELLVYRVDEGKLVQVSSLDLEGESGNARSFDYLHTGFLFGRSRGNDELVFLNNMIGIDNSQKIGSSIDVLISGTSTHILLTSKPDGELQVYIDGSVKKYIDLPARANSAVCMNRVLYIGTDATSTALVTIKPI